MNSNKTSPDDEYRDGKDMPHELHAFENRLATLRPQSGGLNRERLVFLAGQASVAGTTQTRPILQWVWPLSFAAMTALAASLAIVLFFGPRPKVIERIVYLPMSRPTDEVAAAGPDLGSPTRDMPDAAHLPAVSALPPQHANSPVAMGWPGGNWPALSPQFRLFEHLLNDQTCPANPSTPRAKGSAEVNAPILSPGSLRELINETSHDSSTLDSRSSNRSGASGANS